MALCMVPPGCWYNLNGRHRPSINEVDSRSAGAMASHGRGVQQVMFFASTRHLHELGVERLRRGHVDSRPRAFSMPASSVNEPSWRVF